MTSLQKEIQLFFLGFLTLFLELVLIRYLAGTIWNLGYFPNLVLLAAFIGMGVGFLFHDILPPHRSESVFSSTPFVILLLSLFIFHFHPQLPWFTDWLGEIGGELYFTATTGTNPDNSWVFLLWFLTTSLIFAIISQKTAKLFRLFSPLKAYALDISGSCLGIIVFIVFSWLEISAPYWFLATIPIFFLLVEARLPKKLLLVALPCLITSFFALLPSAPFRHIDNVREKVDVRWSPYQKIELLKSQNPPVIFVNGIKHQHMLPSSTLRDSFYQIPFSERANRLPHNPYKKALIIGAGTGNDTATALENDVGSIHAVEIDPTIAWIGKQLHPAKPYSDPRVKLIVDDGRIILNNSQDRYDIIVFALTDSLVKVSSKSQLRLENYLFTEESFKAAFSMLKPKGDLVFYNYYRVPWLIERLKTLIWASTGRNPRTIYQQKDFLILTVNQADPITKTSPSKSSIHDTPTDDWPFLYLKKKAIPHFFLKVMAAFVAITLLFLIFLRWVKNRFSRSQIPATSILTKLAFLLMGTAFLLLETKSVIQFSLLFGTTWLNASLVFLFILLSILLANLVASILVSRHFLFVAYILLIVSCSFTFIFPMSCFLNIEGFVLRLALSSLLMFSPIFFANFIFCFTFKNQALPDEMFGWNLVGATFGGILEYTSMAFGYQFMAFLVMICYTMVVLFLISTRRNRFLEQSAKLPNA